MNHKPASQLKIAICGSASTGKTSLANALARKLELPCLREEMRDYLESTNVDLMTLPSHEISRILIRLWEERVEKEQQYPGFIADNSSVDFAVYALYYGCLNEQNVSILFEKACAHLVTYDAILVLPWGAISYIADGVRPANRYLQLRYQLLLEGLLHHYASLEKVHFLPANSVHFSDRCRWALSLINADYNTCQAEDLASASFENKT